MDSKFGITTFIVVAIIVLILSIIITCIKKLMISNNRGVNTRSNVDHKTYYVKQAPNSQESADVLAKINFNLSVIKTFFKDKYNSDKKSAYSYDRIKNKKISLEENTLNKHTSYSVNKGEKIVLCLRSKADNKIHDINLLMYVVLHEISHVICPEIDHTEMFDNIFSFVRESATKCGVYDAKLAFTNHTEYCGINIENSANVRDKISY